MYLESAKFQGFYHFLKRIQMLYKSIALLLFWYNFIVLNAILWYKFAINTGVLVLEIENLDTYRELNEESKVQNVYFEELEKR